MTWEAMAVMTPLPERLEAMVASLETGQPTVEGIAAVRALMVIGMRLDRAMAAADPAAVREAMAELRAWIGAWR